MLQQNRRRPRSKQLSSNISRLLNFPMQNRKTLRSSSEATSRYLCVGCGIYIQAEQGASIGIKPSHVLWRQMLLNLGHHARPSFWTSRTSAPPRLRKNIIPILLPLARTYIITCQLTHSHVPCSRWQADKAAHLLIERPLDLSKCVLPF